MTDQEKFEELISAALDGELPPSDAARLDAWLADNPEGRELAAGLEALGRELGDLPPLAPPEDLRESILEAVESRRREPGRAANWFGGLFGMEFMRYAGTFGAGVLLTVALATSDTVSRIGAGDTSRLVGTIGAIDKDAMAAHSAVSLALDNLDAAVELRVRDSLLILDIEFESPQTIDFYATFDEDAIRFTGFEQTPGSASDVVSQPGSIALRMTGQRRYALHLDRATEAPATIRVGFAADGETIFEEQWPLEGQ